MTATAVLRQIIMTKTSSALGQALRRTGQMAAGLGALGGGYVLGERVLYPHLPDSDDLSRAWVAYHEKPGSPVDLGDPAAGEAGSPAEQAKDKGSGSAGGAWDWLSERPEVYIPGAVATGGLGLYGLYRMLRSRDEDVEEA